MNGSIATPSATRTTSTWCGFTPGTPRTRSNAGTRSCDTARLDGGVQLSSDGCDGQTVILIQLAQLHGRRSIDRDCGTVLPVLERGDRWGQACFGEPPANGDGGDR